MFYGILFLAAHLFAQQYTPIVLVHGLTSDDKAMHPTIDYIRKYMGDDVYVTSLEVGNGELTSFSNAHTQIEHLKDEICADPHLKNGFNIVAHSQGGLLSRYYVQKYNNPKVHTLITLGSPHQGIYGLPGTLDARFKWLDYMEAYAHNVLYSWSFQHYVSFAGYWHDTLHYDTYLKYACFLPYANNQILHPQADYFKNNLCSLKNMVLVMSHIEEIVEPRESCHFGFYKPGSKTELQTVFETDIYKNDTLGLKTLHESGRLHLRYADCTHSNFQEDEKNFVDNVLDFLRAHPENSPLNSTPQEQITT